MAVRPADIAQRTDRAGLGGMQDIGMAILVVGILVVMVVPIHPFMLDILLVINISTSVIVILTTMYLTEPVAFGVFPSLLLVLTLFRLCLNVASTRLILSNGNAGHVIQAFGTFVVSGNYVVGFVIFSILVVIQFVVITKGAGRISEVAARFTLDAMPGKQMAIDADLNAGLISEQEARERRQHIAREADFYGAMDGATKFVRGDAIAGLIITIVNIIGGLIIGMVQKGMPLMDALTTYTRLTIGDGLVSQLPALIIATASGIVVTRTVSEEDLGRDIVRQLTAYPRAFGMVSAMLFLFGLIPKMPTIPFFVCGAAVALLATSLSRARVEREAEERRKIEEAAREAVPPPEKEEEPEALLHVDAMELEIGYGLIPLADPSQTGDLLGRINAIRRQMVTRMGIVIPPIRIRDNMQLGPNEYVIKIWEAPVAKGELLLGHLLAMNPGLPTEEIEGIETTEPAFGLKALWITPAQRDHAERSGYTIVDPATVLATHLTEIIRRHGHDLLTRQDVRRLIDNLRETSESLIDEAIPNLMTVGDLQKILQNLLRERVSVRNLELIIETLADYIRVTKDYDLLTEHVRQRLARTICAEYTDENDALYVTALGPDIEDIIASSITGAEEGAGYCSLRPDDTRRILEAVAAAADNMARKGHEPIILCTSQTRLHLRRILERQLPNVTVLSYAEIAPNIDLHSEGTVTL
ncbi:MAG: flagellar biosynthesis protein FlhA [Candidatus Hydrogenedentes bacterium]|nr:flagellar biosynthesis protein FlhA [Candidatus Hydrogenedentota bacterium]